MQKSTRGVILAIDQSTNCGVAKGDGSGLPTVRSWPLPTDPEALGEMLFDLRIRLIEEIKAGPIAAVVFEKPLLNQRTPNLTTARKLYSIAGQIEAVCYEFRVRCMEMDAGTWKKAFCGRGNVSKKEKPYPPMVRCHELGIKVKNIDEADAVGIWATYVAAHNGAHWLAGELFSGLM